MYSIITGHKLASQKSLVIHRLIILPQARPPINEVKVQIRSIRDMNRPSSILDELWYFVTKIVVAYCEKKLF